MAINHIANVSTKNVPRALCGVKPERWFKISEDGSLPVQALDRGVKICPECSEKYDEVKESLEAEADKAQLAREQATKGQADE